MPKVLVVEDDQILQRAYSTVLRMEGFEVSSVSDGEEALRVAEEFSPDVILLDILMPNLDGIGFLRSYNAPEKHQHTKIIVFSNVSIPEKIQQASALGASTYMIKATFTPKEMIVAVKEILKKG